jgi:hypothetical protein
VITGAAGLGGAARVAFTVINVGSGDLTQPFTVRVCVSGQCIDKPISATVPAGGAIADLVDVPHIRPGIPVPEPIILIVDPNNETGDVNAGNNTMSLALPLG